MRSVTDAKTNSRRWRILCSFVVLAALSVSMHITGMLAQQAAQGQKTFPTAQQAVTDLVEAARAHDRNQVMQILGPQAQDILSSGDEVADKRMREQFLEKYDQMHRLVAESDGTVNLYIGAENWPFPIPIVNRNNVWLFDTAAGKKEVLYRRIGRNEFSTIDTLHSLVQAQKEYASQPRDRETVKQYAQKLLSDKGRHNGLYWESGEGEPSSPIGPLIAQAAQEGYRRTDGPLPFHGYIYRVLQSQSKNAPGGAMSYVQNGKMTRGFAIIAYPVQYKNSGVMTFIVNQDGQVYEKNLGPRTGTLAKAITTFNPDKTWRAVPEESLP